MRLALTAKLVPLVLWLGCSAAPPPDEPVNASFAPVLLPEVPSTMAPHPLESPTVTLKRELCRRAIDRASQSDRTNEGDAPAKCALAKLREIGDATYVALLYRGPGEWRPDGSSAAELGLSSEGNSDTFGVDFERCEPFEYWLASVADGQLEKAQLITEICNDGHGAAGVGEDTVTVSAGEIAVATNGGSSWRWGNSERFSLPDLTRLSETSDGYWSVSSNTSHTQWSWTERRGASTWEAPRCAAGQVDPPPVSFGYALLPAFESAPVFAGEGWKSARSIEGCATIIDGERAGDALSGAASPASARLALVVAEDKLFVEISDDKLIASGSVRDELEVWHRQEPSSDWSQHCLEAPAPASGTAFQLGDLSTRLLGDKAGKLLSAERAPAKDGAPVRLRVTLPPKTHAVTVVYRDSDDGKRHSLVLASSTFDSKDDATLGVLHRIAPERASCELAGDSFELRMKPHSEPNEAITRL